MVLVESFKVPKQTRVIDLRRIHGKNRWTLAKIILGERDG
jgi:hypothetical protein